MHPKAHDTLLAGLYGADMDGALSGNTYEIVVGATLGADWAAWFEGFEVTAVGHTTVLLGTVRDQAALRGILALLRDLAIPLLDVHRVENGHMAQAQTTNADRGHEANGERTMATTVDLDDRNGS